MTSTNGGLEIFKTDARGHIRAPAERREALLDEFEKSGMTIPAATLPNHDESGLQPADYLCGERPPGRGIFMFAPASGNAPFRCCTF